MTPPDNRQHDLAAFFADRSYVCPYAAAALDGPHVFAQEAPYSFAGMETMAQQLEGWAASWGKASALVIVTASDAPNELEFRRRMKQAFALCWAGSVIADMRVPPEEAEGIVERAVSDTFDDRVPHRPFLTVRGEPMFTVALGAFYDPRHTRHAPHDCLVVTRIREVSEVPAYSKIRIQKRMESRMGALYDADEPIVPSSALKVRSSRSV